MKNLKTHINKTLFNNYNNFIAESCQKIKTDIDVPHIFVGISTCSIIAGANETFVTIKNYLQDNNIDAKLIEVACLGICKFDPIVDVQLPGRNRISFKKIDKNKVRSILDSILNNILPDKQNILGQYFHPDLSSWHEIPNIEDLNFFKLQKRILFSDIGFIEPNSLMSYVNNNGYKAFAKTILKTTSENICKLVEKSELQGRGGGAYLTGKKWLKALTNSSSQKYFICNADESDPGSFGDRAIIESNPHKLLEGIMIGCYAINASRAIIYIRNTYELAIERLSYAIREAEKAGLLGEDIAGSGFNLHIKIAVGPGAYVCGEETALIASLEGKRGTPSTKPPYPSEYGLHGKPTIVNNVETLCNVPGIVLNGAEWFKKLGNSNSHGTKILSVSGKVDYPGIVEIELGSSYSDILKIVLKEDSNFKTKAIHIGGPSGGFIHPDNFSDSIDFVEIKSSKLWWGSGSFLVLDENNCIVDTTKYFIDFIHNESCGKCIPCREGSQRLLEVINRITERPHQNQQHESLLRFKGVIQMENIAKIMKETSLCGLGINSTNTIFSAIKHFREEFEEHIFEKKCEANICKNLRTFSIDVNNCVGCGICLKRCPSDAIIGSPKTVHFIIQERCIKCGNCYEVCKFNAININ